MKNLLAAFLIMFTGSVSAETLWLGETQTLSLYDWSGSLTESNTLDSGWIDYDGVLNSGSAEMSSASFFLHDIILSENVNGSLNVDGYVDILGTTNNLFSGLWAIDYSYYETDDVTIFDIRSLDFDGDGINGALITEGAYVGMTLDFYGEVSFLAYVNNPFPIYSPVPVPAAVWLFGSGLLALAGIARRR